MGARGPLPQSADVLYLRGNPSHRKPKRTVRAKPGAPAAPAWLVAEAKAEWKRVVPELDDLGILAKVDRGVLAAYCDAWAKFTMAARAMTELTAVDIDGLTRKHPLWQIYREASGRVELLAKTIGATPTARLRMTLPEPPDEDEGSFLDS